MKKKKIFKAVQWSKKRMKYTFILKFNSSGDSKTNHSKNSTILFHLDKVYKIYSNGKNVPMQLLSGRGMKSDYRSSI